MQKTNKLFAVVLAFAMVFSMVLSPAMSVSAATDFTDVQPGSQYYEAINYLATTGVIQGQGEGLFAPQDNVKRSEFAKMIVVAYIGEDNFVLPSTGSGFPDVESDHWGAKYIAAAVSMGAVNGYDDGTFKPDAEVTYEQAIKMAVCMIGYKSFAEQLGGYPDGYRQIGEQIRITKSITDGSYTEPAKRGTIAQLIYNMLDVEQIDESTGQKGDSLLTERNEDKQTGQITAVRDISLTTSHTPSLATNEIEIYSNGEYNNYVIDNVFSGQAQAQEYLGYTVKFTYTQATSSSTPVLTSITPSGNKNTKTTINGDQIEDVTNTSVEYLDDDDRVQTLSIGDNAALIYNGKASDKTLSSIYNNEDITSISYMESGNGVLFVTTAVTIVVNSITTKEYKIYDKYDNTVTAVLDESKSSQIVTIKKDGKAAQFSSIQKDDVVSVSTSDPDAPGKQVITALVSSEEASGTIDEVTDATREYVVKGKSYKLTDSLIERAADEVEQLKVGTYVTFYLDSFGRVAAIDTKDSSTEEYGYITKIDGEVDSSTNTTKVRVISVSSSSSSTTMYLAPTVQLNGESYKVSSDPQGLIDALEVISNAQNETYEPEGTKYASLNVLVRYRKNTKGYIDRIYAGSTADDTNLKVQNDYLVDGLKYSGSNSFEGKVLIDSSTKILFVPNDRTDDSAYSRKTASGLKKNAIYHIQVIDAESSSKAAKVILVFEPYGDTDINEETSWYVVTSGVGSENFNGEPTNYVTVLENGTREMKIYEDTIDISDLKMGDVVRLNLDSSNVVTKMEDKKLFNASSPKAGFYGEQNNNGTTESSTTPTQDIGATADFVAIYGTATEKTNSPSLSLTNALVSGGTLDYESFNPAYALTGNEAVLRLTSDGKKVETDISIDEINGYVDVGAEASKLFVIAKDGVVKMIMIVE